MGITYFIVGDKFSEGYTNLLIHLDTHTPF